MSLADIYMQLRRLEFASIGRVLRRSNGFEVGKMTTSIDINMQELEGLEPSRIQASYHGNTGCLKSANDYVSMLQQIAYNAFFKSRNSVDVDTGPDAGADALYHLHMFHRYAKEWANPSFDRGPFTLVHGDFEPFNPIVNDDVTIVAVLDLEWSHVVPVQFFRPPLWLTLCDTTKLAWKFAYENYLETFERFLAVLRTRERNRYKNELLADEWSNMKDDGGFLMANALENWTDMDFQAPSPGRFS